MTATKETLLGFYAPQEESELEVDTSAFAEEPTVPFQAAPERDTGRPSANEMEALVEATRADAAWLAEPRFSFDPDSGRLVLAAPYVARQVDEFGNVFSVECPIGLELEPPVDHAQARAIRTQLVAAALRGDGFASIRPFNGAGKMLVPKDDQWRREVLRAFAEGDAGVRRRG